MSLPHDLVTLIYQLKTSICVNCVNEEIHKCVRLELPSGDTENVVMWANNLTVDKCVYCKFCGESTEMAGPWCSCAKERDVINFL